MLGHLVMVITSYIDYCHISKPLELNHFLHPACIVMRYYFEIFASSPFRVSLLHDVFCTCELLKRLVRRIEGRSQVCQLPFVFLFLWELLWQCT
jgi:hypothetical protein